MLEYNKIETLFDRDAKFKVNVAALRNPVYSAIKEWQVTEKIDGTNIRVHLSTDGIVRFGGRTDNAQIPVPLLTVLQDTFTPEKMKALWLGEPIEMTLFGEGYGGKIQGGGKYNPNPSFRLFDVLVADKWWLNQTNVEDVATKLGIKTAPVLGMMDLEQIILNVKSGMNSIVAMEDSGQTTKSEGIVARTIEPLFDKKGHRLIIKLKTKDF